MADHSSAALASLTSGWQVAPSVRAGDLDKARAVLAAALAAGKSAHELDPALASHPLSPIHVPAPTHPAPHVLCGRHRGPTRHGTRPAPHSAHLAAGCGAGNLLRGYYLASSLRKINGPLRWARVASDSVND